MVIESECENHLNEASKKHDYRILETDNKMKVSDLIDKLQKILKKKGDVEINLGMEMHRYVEYYALLAVD